VVATHLVKLACELPDDVGSPLCLWTCAELARKLVETKVVAAISAQSVQRILSSYRLKPWRVHHWLSSKVPRDEDFRARVLDICALYTRPLAPNEVVLCVDEKTSLQPRPRVSPTRPAQPGRPVEVEHEYERKGAVNLLAAINTRTGKVLGLCRRRKRQKEFIELLEAIERTTPSAITVIHIVCDNVRVHKGKEVQAWLAQHPRFRMHFPPVHCSWMNQIEQWFSSLQRKRLGVENFRDVDALAEKLLAFIEHWNETAGPFAWTPQSFQKVLDRVDTAIRLAATQRGEPPAATDQTQPARSAAPVAAVAA